MKKFWTLATFTWRIIYPSLYSVILIIISWYAFKVNDQGRDFFIGGITQNFSIAYILKSGFFLFTWCLLTWYCGRIVLQVKELDVPETPFTRNMVKWVPRILALLPLVVVIEALFGAADIIGTENRTLLLTQVFATVILGALLLLFFTNRQRIAARMGIAFAPVNTRYSVRKIPLDELLASGATRIAFQIIIITTISIVFPFFFFLKEGYARMLQPASVLLCGFIFFTVLMTALVILLNIRRSPFFIVVGAYIMLASTCNNNNSIKRVEHSSIAARPSIRKNFDSWISQRLDSNHVSYPLIIIAAEGGGIRGTAWTALILKKLQEQDPRFMDHVYAISGVSGGGVGSVFYTAYLRDSLSGHFHEFPSAGSQFTETVGEDFLSDLSAAFIFHDNLQRIIPWPIEALSRNRKLEDSWGWSYEKHLMSSTMSDPFLQLWADSTGSHVPNLFINGLLAETGQKAIVSNLDFKADSSQAFDDDIDVIHELGSDIPVKTAASLCARFPVITSGGLLKKNGDTAIGHVLDGGYKENSGIETAWQLSLALNAPIRDAEARYGKAIPVYILFIRNSSGGRSITDEKYKAKQVMPDLTTILPGFLNAWDRRTITYRNITKELFSQGPMKDQFAFFEISLDNRNKLLPLGWYLSENAREMITTQVDTTKQVEAILKRLK